MINGIERTAYELAQAVRLGWYGGQSTLSTCLSERVPALPDLAAVAHRHVEIGAHQHAPARHIEIVEHAKPGHAAPDPVAAASSASPRAFATRRVVSQFDPERTSTGVAGHELRRQGPMSDL